MEGNSLFNPLKTLNTEIIHFQVRHLFNCRFDNNKVEKLLECLSEEERNDFGFDVSSIDWEDYITRVHFHGVRKHVMKETALK